MKIDTSNIRLFSSRLYSEAEQISNQGNGPFHGIFERKLNNFSYESIETKIGKAFMLPSKPVEIRSSSEWFEFKTIAQLDVVKLSNKFSHELEKMKQIAGLVMKNFSKSNVFRKDHCCCHMNHVKGIDINPRDFVFVRKPVVAEQQIFQQKYIEEEKTSFGAEGIVKTADGKEIDFTFGMDLDREFFREDRVALTETGFELIDPLIINLNSNTPKFSDMKFSFDLNMDGEDEEIQLLAPGSGFLAFDRSNDGIINDGSELFGTSTGNGFSELSAYDEDENYWIDENDSIFDNLSIWENDENGEMHLTRLKDSGVGAIYLVNVETPFSITDNENQVLSQIKRSGIALNEDGTISSVQDMDWVV